MDETPEFYARDSLNVATYDEFAGDVAAGDVDFYLAVARETGGPVLDLGGGTGRVAWPLAEAGIDVTTLDLSNAMLDVSRGKAAAHDPSVARRVEFVAADIRSFDLAARYALAIAPFRVFQLVLTPYDQRAALAAIHRHLRPRGLFVAHLFDPLLELCMPMDGPPAQPDRGTMTLPGTNHPVTIRTLQRTTDPLSQVFSEQWEWAEHAGDGSVLRREEEILRMRWTYRYEMRYLLELAGFTVEAEYSDFHGSPPRYAGEQIWVARRA